MNPKQIPISLEDLTLENLNIAVPSCNKLSNLKQIEHMPGEVIRIKVRRDSSMIYEVEFKYKSGGIIHYEYTQEQVDSFIL